MTHAELYEIVKDHRDVWGKHFTWDYTRELFMEQWPQTISPIRNDIAESALLGLGVAWLVKRAGRARIYGMGKACKEFGTMTDGRWLGQGDSMLSSVYSLIGRLKASLDAIAEVKRGKADSTN